MRARFERRVRPKWPWISAATLAPLVTWWAADLGALYRFALAPIVDGALIAMLSTQVVATALLVALVPYLTRAFWGNIRLVHDCIATGFLAFALGRVASGDRGGVASAASFIAVIALALRPKQGTFAEGPPDLDAPIKHSSEDLFKRSDSVTRCFKFLVNPEVRCPRFALVAPYGTGKSSVALMVREKLVAVGHRFVRFDPWHHTQDEHAMMDALLLSIEQAIGVGAGWMGLRAVMRRTAAALAGKHEWAAGMRMPVERFLQVSNDELAQALAKRLHGRRLVIFVDDLERCAPEVVERVLTMSKETFSVPGLAFLFAIDRCAVLRRLEQRDMGDLLDKVFDDMVDLLPPSPEAMDSWKLSCTNTSWAAVNDALARLSCVLPATPRRRKRFLQRLQSWPVDLSTASTIVDLDAAVALMILEFEAPTSLEFLLNNQEAMDDLQSGAFQDAVAKAWDESNEPRAAIGGPWSALPAAQRAHSWIRNNAGSSRLSALSEHVRWLLSRDVPRRLVLLHAMHGIQTGATPEAWLNTLMAAAEDRASDVNEGLLEYRLLQIEAAAGALDYETESAFRMRAIRVSETRCALMQREGRSLAGDASSFEKALHGLLRWAHFGGDYNHVHDAEWQTLQAQVTHSGSAILEIHRKMLAHQTRGYADPADVEGIVNQVCALTRPRAEAAMQEEQARGIFRIWGGSAEHRSAGLRMLLDLVQTAAPILESAVLMDHEQWDVAHECFTALAEGAGLDPRGHQLAQALWTFLTSKRLNRRMAGSLAETLATWEMGGNRPTLARPEWWSAATTARTEKWAPKA